MGLKRNEVRRYERYQTNFPIAIYLDEKCILGKVVNISEGGLAYWVKKAIYVPTDQTTEYRMNQEGMISSFEGEIVHVDRDSQGYTYAIKAIFQSEEQRNKYNEIVKLAREHENKLWGTHFVSKVFRNLVARSKRKIFSRRRTARIEVNEIVELSDGTVLWLENYNFEYARVSLIKGVLSDHMILFPTKTYAMHCTQSPWNPYLFSIDNQEELAQNKEFQALLEQWSHKKES